MLQPRLSSVCGSAEMRNFGGFRGMAALVLFALLFSATLVSCQDVNLNEEESIDATRIKREGVQENRDLTVLLVNDQKRSGEYNSKIGRYHSVKPLIGLLTSTARTFIQDGVTTEFATQILGTTLDNGRIYAQLLTKSSLVLYNKPSNVDDSINVKPTKSNFDGQWSVKQDLGFIDPEKFILKNTDYLAPNSKMDIVYASKATPDNLKSWGPPSSPESYSDNQIYEEPVGRKVVQDSNEIPRYEAYNFLDGPKKESGSKFVVNPSIIENVNTLHRQSKAYDVTPETPIIESRLKEEFNESNVVKVKPGYDLPTFTIKNEFSPIFYYIDNVESRGLAPQAGMQTKLPKKLFGQKSEPRPKKTFTYAGFADFTTVVGDTVIVFTPNTDIAQDPVPGQVNVFPSANKANKLATKITFLASDIPVATSTYKAHEAKINTKLANPSSEENRSEKALYNDEESLKKVLYEVDKMPDTINVQYDHGFDLNMDVIQPSEAVMPSSESSRITDDLGVIPIQGYNSKATEPLNTLKPSATILEAPKESVVIESDVSDFTNSEEEWENTAEEVTDRNNDETTSTDDDEEILTTTESGSSDESEEEIDGTTEGYNADDSEELICTKGLETYTTKTTAYKTLTYLTTYFIPLEGTDMTTSVKSDVVVERSSGYLTNVVCKTELNIEPTAVVSVISDVKSSIQSSLEQSEKESKKASTQPIEDKVVTDEPTTTTQAEKDTTTLDDELGTVGQRLGESSSEEKDQTTTTTTERTSTTQSHLEFSVSTEQSSTTTEKVISEKDRKEEINPSENEIDLIYKTLYTTYTYFTTFFGDSTSSVESHKSIVTNIITSTINLNNLDPSLLGEFNNDEIAPTSVGIGRPTESYNPVNSIIELVKNQNLIDSVESDDVYTSRTPTPSLDDDIVASIKPDGVKTYFTTYTFFTTIYVGSDANVCSRSEVYTNYVGPEELIPTKTNPLAANTKAQFDFRNCKQVKRVQLIDNDEDTSSMESSIRMEEPKQEQSTEKAKKETTPNPSPVEVDMLFSVESNPLESDNSYVTDVKSSSSKGEQKYLENNNVLEDQISSESNIEEIMPSPTLLLQTSYTTFTYFTTMYIGKDSSKVKSRLETITNVVTETITPKKEVEVEESNLPITYYTTFTYWTTLYKDKSTTITSREEIVSNVVTPTVQVVPTVSINPIDTTPIEVDSVLPPKDLEVQLKPSLIGDSLESDDGKATFYTTYTYFTTFYVGNTSQIRSSLETVTNIVDNTKLVDDNQLGRKVPTGPADKNLVQDSKGNKNKISPTVVKEEIKPTKLPDISAGSPTVLLGTYIDNLFAEVKSGEGSTPTPGGEKKILYSQVAVISGDSTIVTNDNITLNNNSTSAAPSTSPTTEKSVITSTPDVIESSEADSSSDKQEGEDEEDDDGSSRKKSRLTFTTKKPTFTPVIRPFASRNRPTFSPKRVPSLSSATIITRSDFTPTITATPALKSVRPSGFGANRKQSAFPGASGSSRRFSGRSSIASPSSANVPAASRSGGFNRASIQPTSRRTGFRTSSLRSNSIDFSNRSAAPRIRPTATSRLRGSRQSASVSQAPINDQNESETSATQVEENATESLDEVTEAPVRTTNNPLLRFRRPLNRTPGTAVTPRSTTQTTTRRTASTRGGRVTTTTRRPTTRSTTNPLLSLRRQRPNALFPKRNLFKEPEPQPEEEIKENEQSVDNQNDEILESDDLEVDNDYESSERKEQQVSTSNTQSPRQGNSPVQIRPFRRRSKRQVDYGNRTKYSNFRRPGPKPTTNTRRSDDDEQETEAPTSPTTRTSNRYRGSTNTRTTSSPAVTRPSSRQPFIVRGESRSTTPAPSYRIRNPRPSTRTTTSSSRPKTPRLQSYNSQTTSRSNARSSSGRSRARGSTRANSRQRNSYESSSGERQNYNHLVNDGKITVTHQIPIEVTIPVVNGKITEYKQVLTAKPSLQTLLLNQVSTSLGPLGNQQLILATEATELADNGATKIIKFLLHETPTSTVVFTPTTIRGRKTSYSHILPSTVYNVEPITSTITPEISANVPLANLLLSQLLLGNQQPAINPLLALHGQGLLPQQQAVVPTPVTEYKTRTTTYVTTVTDARETVLPITFRGIPILTTIKDPTINVITATEYITDTLVTTPTVLAQQQPQFNSLLLPLLLQQQQQQHQQQQAALALQTPNPLLGLSMADLGLVQNNLINNDIYSNSPKPNILSDLVSNEDFADNNQDYESGSQEDAPPPPPPPPSRHKNKPRLPKPAPPKITSVVTLYVSGRTPGEFSTVLSTVVSDDTQTVRKREAIYFEDVKVLPSMIPTIDELISSQSDDVLDNSIIADSENFDPSSIESQIETQSLESIVGELNKHIRYDASPTYVVKLAKPSIIRQTQNSDNVS